MVNFGFELTIAEPNYLATKPEQHSRELKMLQQQQAAGNIIVRILHSRIEVMSYA